MKIFYLSFLFLIFSVSSGYGAPIPEDGKLKFKIERNGSDFGTHILHFSRDEKGRTVVDIEINMSAGFGPFTLFRYEHTNREIWNGDQIISLESETNDDGESCFVSADWGEQNVKVTYQDGAYRAPAATTYSTSYWNPVMLEAEQLVNSQKGQLEDITVTATGPRSMKIGGENRMADGYIINANVPIKIWYDQKTGQWTGLDFEIRGSRLTYHRITPFGE